MIGETYGINSRLTIGRLRAITSRVFQFLSYGLAVICSAVAWIGGQDVAITIIMAGFAAVVSHAACAAYGGRIRARLVVAVSMASQATIIIFAASKLSAAFVQEAHMFYYVLNCLLLGYACWRTLAFYNAVAALLLIGLSLVDPQLIWTAEGAPDRFYHLAVHGLIATILVGPLVFGAEKLRSTFQNNEAAVRSADKAADDARASARRAERDQHKSEQKAVLVREAAHGIDSQLKTLFNDILAATHDVGRSAHSVASVSLSCRDTTRTVESQFDRTTSNIMDVVDAAGALARSVKQVAARADAAATRAHEAVSETAQAMHLIETLSQSGQQVGDITRIIQKIATSINLLALNTTIESSRAGVSGRGFTVVAQNVQALAGQTSKATEEIAGVISKIQDETHNAVVTINSIGVTIKLLYDQALDIAISTGQQTAMTASIGDTASVIANEAADVRTQLATTRQLLTSAKIMSGELLEASDGLRRMTETSTEECVCLLDRLHNA